jgi:N-carbamoylputrescine amidase
MIVMRVALVTEVFFFDIGAVKLREHLRRAKAEGADLAVLPELPLNEWAPYSKVPKEKDAEPVDGPRQRAMSAAAAEIGIGLLGGAIVIDPATGARHNTALLYGPDGACRARYRKIHLPEEEGYWETSHYEPGTEPPTTIDGFPLRLGLQICSDVNRPEGFQLLAAQGAEVVCAPRATPPETWERWRTVLRANALMSGAWVVSVNRPRSEHSTSIGGPSVVIDPTGEVVVETNHPVHVVDLTRSATAEAAVEYPGYLKRFPELYARGWEALDA